MSGVQPAAPDPAERRKLVRNEQRKLAATALNNIAVATVVTGIVAPVIASAYHVSTPHGKYWAVFPVLWVLVAMGIHQLARRMLEELEP